MAVSNTVDYLKSITFSKLKFSEQCEIKKRGRPTPDLIIKQEGISHNKKYTRSFNPEFYNKFSWLCGCEYRNKLFCFPCLLFGGDTVWTQNGFSSVNRTKEKCEKHQLSLQHKNNVISLGFLGQVNISENISDRLAKVKHNEQVKKNRNFLSKLIDAIKFCGQHELPFQGYDESESSDNQCLFRGLLDYQAKVDPELREHFYSNSFFKGKSRTKIQNELLQCILEVCQDYIAAEIKEATFLAVMVDEITDAIGQTQTVIVFRYVLDGTVYERYWGSFKPEYETADDGLSQCILTQLKTVLENDDHKLIAQTYDGANVMSGARQGVQKKIQDVYKNANYVHCYAHPLNLIIKHVISSIQSVRTFFTDVSGIPTFFSQSPKRLEVLKRHMPVSIPRLSNTRWNFNSVTVNFVFENKKQLINCFTEMVSRFFQNDKTFDKAKGYLALLENETFLFWLQFFREFMPHVELLFNQMQIRDIDATLIKEAVESFCNAIQMIRDSEVCMSASQSRVVESRHICDRIIMEFRDRFAFSIHLLASRLFYVELFPKYRKTLPNEEISEACQTFSFLEEGKLKTELSLLYSRPEFCSYKGLVPLLQKLISLNLLEVFHETTKLLEILITMPITTAEPERCFTTLKRIKTYQRNSMNQERLLAFSMMSIEKNMISNIEDFNQKVIEKFCSKTRMEFTFEINFSPG